MVRGIQADVAAAENPPNAAPEAFSIAVSLDEDTVLNGGLLWAFDAETPIEDLMFSIQDPAVHGVAEMTGQRSFSYAPSLDFHGEDSFTFTVSDGEFSATATVSITVNSVNDAPLAFDSEASTFENTAIHYGLVWAFDAEGSRLTYELVNDVQHGTINLLANGVFIYTPDTDYIGPDSFTFRVFDGAYFSNTAVVSLNVFNEPPVAYDSVASTPLNTDLNGGKVWAWDPEGKPLTYELVDTVRHGKLTFRANGTFDYTPADGYTGPDNFTFLVNDGSQFSNIATFSLAVANQSPSAFDAKATIPVNTTLTGGRVWGFDAEGQPLTFELVTPSPNGIVDVTANGFFSFKPATGFTGETSFTYRAFDGVSFSNTARMTITVTPAAPAPGVRLSAEDATTPLNLVAPTPATA